MKHKMTCFENILSIYHSERNSFNEGNVEHGDQYSLKFIYEHVLERNAFSMCKGSFGGVSQDNTHEYICVQSMDGMLSIFEYESFSVSFFFPKVLIPGPFKYISRTDSFITLNSSWELDSYKYQVLATSSSIKSISNEGKKFKRILPDFSINLGESILDIEVLQSNNSSCFIVVLGEKNLYCLSDSFQIKFIKKFDYNPSSFCAYLPKNSTSNSVNFIIATHSKLLFVHEDVKVKWAAQLEKCPVQVKVGRINDTDGVIVTLTEDGQLKCSYLGTEPAYLNPTIKEDVNKIFNFEIAEKEYRQLQAQIKNAIMNTGSVVSNLSKSGLVLNVDIPKNLDNQSTLNRNNRNTELMDPIDSIPSITCKITLKSIETVQNVKVIVNCSLPIVATPDTICFSSIGSVAYEQEICFFMKTKHIPSNLNVKLCTTYTSSTSISPFISETKFRLPLKLVMKNGQHSPSISLSDYQSDSKEKINTVHKTNNLNFKKLTLETNRPCLSLNEVFPEFSSSYQPSFGNIIVVSFYGHANINVTIQGSKSGANRYRIQSESFDVLWLVAEEFVKRLENFFLKQSQEVTITYHEPLPIEDLRICIDKHLELRKNIEKFKEMLEQSCIQFRAIQKRLLIKFKDKSPTSLENMDALLEATYRQILALSESYLATQKELSIASSSLNCISQLSVLLICLTYKFNKENREILESIMALNIENNTDLGWEEIVNSSLSNMIRNALSKSSKEFGASTQQSNQLKLIQDSNKIEKQLKSFLSRLENGCLILPNAYNINTKTNETPSILNLKDNKSQNTEMHSKFVPGEDYFTKNSNINEENSIKASQLGHKQINEPKTQNKLLTFEELMESEEIKKKTLFNFDDLDDI